MVSAPLDVDALKLVCRVILTWVERCNSSRFSAKRAIPSFCTDYFTLDVYASLPYFDHQSGVDATSRADPPSSPVFTASLLVSFPSSKASVRVLLTEDTVL